MIRHIVASMQLQLLELPAEPALSQIFVRNVAFPENKAFEIGE